MDYQQEYYKKELLDREVRRLTLTAIKQRKSKDESYTDDEYASDVSFINSCATYTDLKKYYKSRAKVGEEWYKRILIFIHSHEGPLLQFYLRNINRPVIHLTLRKKNEIIRATGTNVVLTKDILEDIFKDLHNMHNDNRHSFIKDILYQINKECHVLFSSINTVDRIKLNNEDINNIPNKRIAYPMSKDKYPELYKVMEVEIALRQYNSFLKYLFNKCLVCFDIDIRDICKKINCEKIFDKVDRDFFKYPIDTPEPEMDSDVSISINYLQKLTPGVTQWSKPRLTREQVNVMFNVMKMCNIINRDVQRQSMDVAISLLTGYSEKQIHKGTNTPTNQIITDKSKIEEIQEVLKTVIDKLEEEKRTI